MIHDLSDLQKTVEKVRSEKYSDIPEELIINILKIEANEDRSKASKKIMQLIEQSIEREEVV